ncbi:MAG: 2'-5' RNA ligase family protein [Bacteroidia bacterium]|nr:2'-5' RNA ligase family protein [Bacteroidia bacterium]
MQNNIAKYFIAIVPPEPLATDLFEIKKQFSQVYNTNGALRSPAHITLHMPFEFREDKENKIMDILTTFSAAQTCFEIQLNGYGFFEPRVVFIQIPPLIALIELQNSLTQHTKSTLNLLQANYRQHAFHPHLTVAFRDLKKAQFYIAKKELENKTYVASFTCNNIALLKHIRKTWEVYKQFSFK